MLFQPALFRLFFIPVFTAFYWFNKFKAICLITAKFSGALSVLILELSSWNWTSNTQFNWFSIPQWPRIASAKSSALFDKLLTKLSIEGRFFPFCEESLANPSHCVSMYRLPSHLLALDFGVQWTQYPDLRVPLLANHQGISVSVTSSPLSSAVFSSVARLLSWVDLACCISRWS